VLAQIPDLTFSDIELQFLDDPEALIAKYAGHATVTFNGKRYDQLYITEIRTRHGAVASYSEYFDTAVLNEAFTP
jgi:ketosteroid isomerase-like protein